MGLGSNIGDSARTIRAAFTELSHMLENPCLSSLWHSKARYYECQPDFINAVVSGFIDVSPKELLSSIHRIEARFGRNRNAEIDKGPRPLDIDILYYDGQLIVEPDLIVPHASLKERKFVLLPLLELSPELIDPATGEYYIDFLCELPSQGIYLSSECQYDLIDL